MQAARTDLARQYEQEGYVIVRDVLDDDLIGEASRHVEWLQRRHPDLSSEELGTRLVKDDPFWVRLVSDDRLLDVAEQFVGPDIALFASHYISKPPYEGRPVLWHQDGSYWPLEPMEVVTLWLAVDDATPGNGCMQVIPGTHTLELQALQQRSDVDSVLGSGIDEALVDESRAVDIALRAGDIEIHHPNIVHGSHANTSPRRRCGLTIRYIPTTTRILTDEPWPSAYLLRGEAVPGVNQYQPRPTYVEGVHLPFRGSEAFSGSR
jgi:ectoine hydroxylase-related dioxygenase (phytanoyl-CoA dioxygenase family)